MTNKIKICSLGFFFWFIFSMLLVGICEYCHLRYVEILLLTFAIVYWGCLGYWIYFWDSRAAIAPDFFQGPATVYNKGGFAFVFGTQVINGICHFTVFFQNRFEAPCQAMTR